MRGMLLPARVAGVRALFIPKALTYVQICIAGMRGMHVFTGGGSESPIYKSYPFELYVGYAGMRGRRLPVEVAGVCERFIPLST